MMKSARSEALISATAVLNSLLIIDETASAVSCQRVCAARGAGRPLGTPRGTTLSSDAFISATRAAGGALVSKGKERVLRVRANL